MTRQGNTRQDQTKAITKNDAITTIRQDKTIRHNTNNKRQTTKDIKQKTNIQKAKDKRQYNTRRQQQEQEQEP